MIFWLVLTACQPAQLDTSRSPRLQLETVSFVPEPAASAAPRPYFAELKKPASDGSLSLSGNTLTLALQLPPQLNDTPFHTQLLDLGTASKIVATVSDSHGKSYTPVGAVAGEVNYPPSGVLALTFNNVIPDPLLIVELQVKDGLGNIVQADLAAALRHTGTTNPSSTINFQTTAVAKTMKALLSANAARARSISLPDLVTLMNTITGITGTDPNFTFAQNHPSLVKTAQLATDLVASEPASLTGSAASYRGLGATVDLSISGLIGADKIQVQVADAASAVRTNLGNGASAGNVLSLKSTPGNGLKVLVSPFGSPALSYTYTVTPSSLNLTEGGTQAVTITAAPTLNISSFSPASGPAGSTVTISGVGFTGATAVSFNGVAASYSVDSDSQITATVPGSATDGVITVVNGASVNSATSFNVTRGWYVKATAGGAGTGLNWTDAFTGLQAALAVASSGDEVWVATGRYTPHASDRNTSFSIPAGVKLYGGFAGNEVSLGARDWLANPTTLSGDLNGNDFYSPTAAFTNNSDNTRTLVTVSNGSLLDGFTLQGTSNGTSNNGMAVQLFNNTGVVLNNLIIQHHRTQQGALNINTSGSISVSNTTFSDIYASSGGSGGGVLILGSSAVTASFDRVSFVNNQDLTTAGKGLGISCSGAGGVPTVTVSNAVFANNLAENSSSQGGAISNTSCNMSLTNATVANNTALTGPGIYWNGTGAMNLKNVLFWNNANTGNVNLGSGQGNVVAAANPFVNGSNPNGFDGLARTADDGLLLMASATDVIDLGISGAGIPTTDIRGIARSGNPEPGAYEYVVTGPAPVITGFSPSSGTPGTTVTITGSGFTGATAVRFFNTPATSYTVNSDTQITATVPLGAGDGTISVISGGAGYSSTSFDYKTVWLVKANASGANNGLTWNDAFTSLQSAITAASSGEDIWVAAGTYKPHASSVTISFQLKSGVNVYGGFAGNETSVASRNPAVNLTLLSGDLQNDDNTTVTPFTTATANSNIVVRGNNSSLLDGVTISGAADTGMMIDSVTTNLNNVIIAHNKASAGAAGLYIYRGNAILNEVTFMNNSAPVAAGLYIRESSATVTRSRFFNNSASIRGGAIAIDHDNNSKTILLQDILFTGNSSLDGSVLNSGEIAGSLTLDRVIMAGNPSSGGPIVNMNLYNRGATTISVNVKNTVIVNNACRGGGNGFSLSGDSGYTSFRSDNVTFANNPNPDDGIGYGRYNVGIPNSTFNNLLTWNAGIDFAPSSGGGNVSLGTGGTPFVNSADPDGADNIWFTADDGYNVKGTTTAAINTGVSSAGVPTTDIVLRNRNGLTDVGAYEYYP